jgi:DNA-binding LytR/AlgR family response regulator
MIKAIAVDDEPMALEVIKAHAKKVGFIDLQATFFSATEALEYLRKNNVDLLFLDINMPEISGIDFSQILPSETAFIFTTAYSEYAVDAFKLNALDYLLKPIDFGRFMQACKKAQEAIKKGISEDEFIFVKDGYDWVKISLPDLMYVRSEGNYVTFYELKSNVMTRMTMKEVAELLPDNFVRVYKSNIVNLLRIKKIERHQVMLDDGTNIPISARYAEGLLEKLKQNWRMK